MRQYVVYQLATGNAEWFWVVPDEPVAPEGMGILEIEGFFDTSRLAFTRVVDGELVGLGG